MSGDAADAKLQALLLLARSARGAAMADLIARATAEPGLHAFGELLALPAAAGLAGSLHAPALALLELFAHGDWAAYAAAPPGAFGAPLSAAQERKLRLLTVVGLAAGRRSLGYSELLAATGLGEDARALEELLIAGGLYGGALKGRLDQRARCFLVEDAAPRDVPRERLGAVAATLEGWLARARAALGAVEATGAWAAEAGAAAAARRAAAEGAAAAETHARAAADLAAAADPGGALGAGGGAGDEGAAEAFALLPGGDEGARPAAGARVTKRRR
jgi:COP9 signalosome complex subunit 7